MKRITQGVPAPRLRNSQISVNMERIILKATATRPQDRYQTAEDMVEDLEAIRGGDGELRDSDPSGILPLTAPLPRTLDKYDVFISYSDEDEKWVKGTLLTRLEEADLRVCIGDRDFEPGVAILINTEDAVECSRKTVIVLTPAWVQSEWAVFQSLLARTADPAGRQARMIPLLLSKCQVPRWIDFLARLDFTEDEDHAAQLQRLIKALKKGPLEALPGSEAGAA